MRSRVPIIVGATAFALGVLVLLGGTLWLTRPSPEGAAQPSLVGGSFSLVDHDGDRVTQEDFRGHPFLVFFGFTHCPDICPATLFEVSQVLNELGPEAGGVKALFVTVDPERDTKDVMRGYVSNFNPAIRGLTGTRAEVDDMVKAYRAYSKRVPLEDGGYTMDHTAIVYLMDAEGNFVSPLNMTRSTAEIAQDLRARL